jgi:multiple sugar transport system substrate-binding protein
MKRRLLKSSLIILLIFSFSLSGCSFSGCAPGGQQQGPGENITLVWWGSTKDEDYFSRIIERFEDSYSNIEIEYVQKNESSYEEELVDALAANRGPDIAMIHSDWFYKHQDKLAPLTLDEERRESFENTYLPVVYNLMLQENQLYGIPLQVDTIGLYYNQDLFNEARVKNPPATWAEFNDIVEKISKRKNGRVITAGAAIGTANNISQADEVLLTMMLQNGTEITSSDKNSATFHTAIQSSDEEPVYTGREALEYYTAFTDKNRTVYTWTPDKEKAWLEFAEGNVAMHFDYYSKAEDIYNRNPYLDFEFARMPQIKNASEEEQKVYGSYWFHGVTNNTVSHEWAWKFTQYLSRYMASSSLIEQAERYKEQKTRDDIFFGQALLAETVYKGKQPEKFDEAIRTMIENVATDKQDIRTAIDSAAAKVTKIYKESK